MSDPVYSFLSDFCDTDQMTILLNHRPESFYFGSASEVWNIDLLLSGHTHGGLVRIPRLGGLYAPIQGFFPDVYYGQYQLHSSTMLVTSGLAGYGVLPRINNPPEIVTVTLIPQTNT